MQDKPPAAPPDGDYDRRIAVLEERMKTMQAQYEGALDRLRADIARQELRLTITVVGTVVGTVGLAVAILGFLIRLP